MIGGGVYQAFRWWGVGTIFDAALNNERSLSSVPVVGCRNNRCPCAAPLPESIKRSGGGVSEQTLPVRSAERGVYQAFRWWGVGTQQPQDKLQGRSLSSVPVVGCRNSAAGIPPMVLESIKRSGGGVSEPICATSLPARRVYQAFRWWGVGTRKCHALRPLLSLSSVPVVGCRNEDADRRDRRAESIKRSGGGVSERRPCRPRWAS